MAINLFDHQLRAIEDMRNGCILCGGVGSGKSRTAIGYYYKENGGGLVGDVYHPMKDSPQDLYIITTAKKRDDKDWEKDMAPFLLTTNPEISIYNHKIVVDSWNNIQKYSDVRGAFFIFDENKLSSWGVWSKTFVSLAKKNNWILATATPGDKWEDYLPVFLANGFYRTKTEFEREHIVWSRFTKYKSVDRYIATGRLVRLRNSLLVDMEFARHTIPHHEDILVSYDVGVYKDITRLRKNPFVSGYIPCCEADEGSLLVGRDIAIEDVSPILEGWYYTPEKGDYVKLANKPITTASELCYTLRKVVNADDSRQIALMELYEQHPRMIVFYNFDYELDILKSIYYGDDVEVAEWNGHKHQPIPDSKNWVYLVQYTAGCEGFNCIKTDTIVFYSQNYSYKVMTQASGRIDRLNTPYTDLYYYHLKSKSGIDLAISKALKEKKTFNEGRFVKW